ncbi:MAG: TerC family protein [Hyphomicrobiaceae bacterium]
MDTISGLLLASALGLPVWVWLAFVLLVLALLALDLGLFHGTAHEPDIRESAQLAGFCIALGFTFSIAVWWIYYSGIAISLDQQISTAQSASQRAWTAWELYLTGWVIEVTLAFDNVFVMSMIFTYLAIPPRYQHRVLFDGIIGVIVLRALMIGAGAALIHQFSWILYFFSAFLVLTGIKMLMMADEKPDIENNVVLKWMRRHLRITPGIEGQRFVIKKADPVSGKLVTWFTPLFVALVLIEIADLIFAVDSVPAIFAITQDPFIVYTSNIFAILGLRSLYFVLAAMVHRFHYLKYALALVLVYVGAKVFVQQLIGKIPPEISLGITVILLGGGIVFSLLRTRKIGDSEGQSGTPVASEARS